MCYGAYGVRSLRLYKILLTIITACVKINALSIKKMKKKFRIQLSVWQFLALGYFIVIMVGSILLVLPFASADGNGANYLQALFTATSATCVTGLTVVNTAADWSLFGQIVILILIQTGGLGFMTFVSTVFLLFKHGIGLYERRAMLASAGGSKRLSGVSSLIKRIFIGTAVFELAGACLLSIRFIPDFGAAQGIYYSVWHSVSAFCNAGFDLMGADSLANYATDPLVTITLCLLIITGGLGFCVWGDVADCKFNIKKFQLNTKVVLFVTTLINLFATALFLLFEWDNPLYSGYNFGEKLLCALFNAVSPRTAGFYTTAPADLSESGYLLTLILMFIGGNSGSTAGGIKVGTFAVIIMGMLTAFRGRRDINIGKKRLDYSQLSQALAIFAAFLMLVMLAALTICATEPDALTVKAVVFECVSALGTVGLSTGITPQLGIASQIILIVLMYAGRVGILTLALALGEKRNTAEVRKPVDTMLIG